MTAKKKTVATATATTATATTATATTATDITATLWEQAVKAGTSEDGAAARTGFILGRWAMSAHLDGMTASDMARALKATGSPALSSKATTITGGYLSAAKHVHAALIAYASDGHPAIIADDVTRALFVTGNTAPVAWPVEGMAARSNGRRVSGTDKAETTFPLMAPKAALSELAAIRDADAPVSRATARFIAHLTAYGIDYRALLVHWLDVTGTTITVTGGHLHTVESTPVESTPVESTPVESTPVESDPWRYVALAVEALARVEAHAAELTPAQRGTAWKSLGASMVAVRAAYVAANDAASVKA